MDISVKTENLGALKKAEFKVNNITLICGDNNQGKTYAAYSLYGFLNFITNNVKAYKISYEIFYEVQKKFIDLEKFRSLIIEYINKCEKEYLKNELCKVLSIEEEKITNTSFSVNLDFYINKLDISGIKEIAREINEMQQASLTNKDENYYSILEINENNEISLLVGSVFNFMLILKLPQLYIVSAERTGALMFYRELDNNKGQIVSEIQNMDIKREQYKTIKDIIEKRTKRYPSPVNDNIRTIREADFISKQKSFIVLENNELHTKIINLLSNLIGGKYIINDVGIYFAQGVKHRVRNHNPVVPITAASSSVKSLFLLNLYIMHQAKKDDILMIDEPELNLHPKRQILLARLICLLSKIGIKILITTHSDYIVRELDSCIMLNKIDDNIIKNIHNKYYDEKPYDKYHKLSHNDISIYNFNNGNLKEIKITDKGIEESIFDNDILSQNENRDIIEEEFKKADNEIQ